MSDHTITIPADLFYGWTPDGLRHAAESNIGVRILLRRLADEIERQAPRTEGWYLVTYRAYGEYRQRVIYWTGHDWRLANYPSAERVADSESADTITPVTIGRADS